MDTVKDKVPPFDFVVCVDSCMSRHYAHKVKRDIQLLCDALHLRITNVNNSRFLTVNGHLIDNAPRNKYVLTFDKVEHA